MENPIISADRIVMYGVNRFANAYNFTTGGTRSDLANNLLDIASIIEVFGSFVTHPVAGLTAIPVSLGCSHFTQIYNSQMDTKDQDFLEGGVLDLSEKELVKLHGYVFGAMGFLLGFVNNLPDRYASYEVGGAIVGAGCGARGLASLVMACDYLPPKKNCVSRGLDKLAELISKNRKQVTA